MREGAWEVNGDREREERACMTDMRQERREYQQITPHLPIPHNSNTTRTMNTE